MDKTSLSKKAWYRGLKVLFFLMFISSQMTGIYFANGMAREKITNMDIELTDSAYEEIGDAAKEYYFYNTDLTNYESVQLGKIAYDDDYDYNYYNNQNDNDSDQSSSDQSNGASNDDFLSAEHRQRLLDQLNQANQDTQTKNTPGAEGDQVIDVQRIPVPQDQQSNTESPSPSLWDLENMNSSFVIALAVAGFLLVLVEIVLAVQYFRK